MRTFTKTITVYSIDELKDQALEQALKNVSERRHQQFVDFDASEFIKSADAFAKRFGFEIKNYSVGFFYQNSYMHVEPSSYFEKSNQERNQLVAELNRSILDETNGACSLTGVHTDCYFFDFFKKAGDTSYNRLHKDVVAAIQYALRHFVSDTEKDILDNESTKQFIKDFEMEFLPDGSIYYED